MAAIKEKDLPNASTINTTDYVRVVESGGASKKAPGSVIYSGMITLDTPAAAGTTDRDQYRAIQALGWTSDVIE